MVEISKRHGVEVHCYGKPRNYSLGGFTIDGVTAEPSRVEAVKEALGKHPRVINFLAPYPGNGELADPNKFLEVPGFRNLHRGAKGDVCEIIKGEAYVVSAADCLVGYVCMGEAVFAFHAGWQELPAVLSVLSQEIRAKGCQIVYGAFGLAMGTDHLSLVKKGDPVVDAKIDEVVKLAKHAGTLTQIGECYHLNLAFTFGYNLCAEPDVNLFGTVFESNTKDRGRWWSNRLDGKTPQGVNQSNLIIIHNKGL
jgi:hypothetical protein